jgi:hypothetical protein
MTKRSDIVFKTLQVIVWIIFIGLSIEAGGIIVNFIYSLFKPEVVRNLYQKLDLSEMYARSQAAYFVMYSLLMVIAIMKAHLFYAVIKLMSNFNLAKPFNTVAVEKITRISYYTLSIGLLSYFARESTRYLQQHGFDIGNLNQFWGDSQAFILMAAVIYVIASIFKKGVEIQNENDLTV